MENPELNDDGGIYMTKKEYKRFIADQNKKTKRQKVLWIIYTVLLMTAIFVLMGQCTPAELA